MRTTLALDDDAAKAVQAYAKTHKVSRGKAASELIRRGTKYQIPIKYVNGLAVCDVPPWFPKVTTEEIKRLLEDE
jgi:hypothetical protein